MRIVRDLALGAVLTAALLASQFAHAGVTRGFEWWVKGGEWSFLREFFVEAPSPYEWYSGWGHDHRSGWAVMERIEVRSVDLDGDGLVEVLAVDTNGCGNAPGCSMYIFQIREGEWTLIGSGSSNYDVTDLWENGYRVIYTPYYRRLTWDGTRYAFSDEMDVDYYLAQDDGDSRVGREEFAHLLDYVGTRKMRGLLREVRPELEALLGDDLPSFLEYTVDFEEIELSGHFLVARDRPRIWTEAILVVDLY